MSLFNAEDERRIRLQALVREWAKSGLLDPAQGAAIEAGLRVDVRRTNVFLRAGLALFTALIVAASVTFVVVTFDLDHPIPEAVVSAISAVVCLALAHYLVVRYRFYRFGVEEALAAASAALMAIAAFAVTAAQDTSYSLDAPLIAALTAGAAGSALVFRHFGYVYAAIGALACVAALPFHLDIPSAAQHSLAAAALAAAFVAARAQCRRYGDEYPGDDYALVQAAAWAGAYLTLNLQMWSTLWGTLWSTGPGIAGPFYWFTYGMIWALPLAGLFFAIRRKERALLAVSLVMLLVTLVSNKPYLGWPRHEWDPMVLGVFLMAAAIAVRRWLAGGTNGQRAGFTPARILSKEAGAVAYVGIASAAFQPGAPPPQSGGGGVDGGGGGGGRSGGGGASGTY